MIVSVILNNYFAATRGDFENIWEIVSPPPKIKVFGAQAEHLANEMELHAKSKGIPLTVVLPSHEDFVKTQIVFYYGHKMLEEIETQNPYCDKFCVVKDGSSLVYAAIAELGWFTRKVKVVYVNLEPLAVNGTVEGEAYECMLERAVSEIEKLANLSDICSKFYQTQNTTYKISVAVSLFEMSI